MQEYVVPMHKYDCTRSHRGEFTVEVDGQIVIIFDNTYSWLTSKVVKYSVQVISHSAKDLSSTVEQ